MSFTPGSVQKEYALVASIDPALALPEDKDERENALRVARETGNWAPLIKPGESPTLFWVRPLPGYLQTWIRGHAQRHQLSGEEAGVIALRLALRRFENFGGRGKCEIEKTEDEWLASKADIAAITDVNPHDPSVGLNIVAELGWVVFNRLMEGLSPK